MPLDRQHAKVIATIEARMASSRLPGKVLRTVQGKPTLELLIERLRRVARLDEIVVATTVNPADQVIESLAKRLGVGCFRGSEQDVLGRVLGAARSANADVIVEITGDCPLIDPEVVSRILDEYLASDADHVSNILHRTYPIGMDTQVFATDVLARVDALTQDPTYREHVSLYIYKHPEQFSLKNVASYLPAKWSSVRLTLDTPEDLALVASIYDALYPHKPAFSLRDVLDLLERHPEWLNLNGHIRGKKVRAA